MKNLNIDKLIKDLTEAKDILKECNSEMLKALGEAKTIKYAIRDKESGHFYNSDFEMWVYDVDIATVFKSEEYAISTLETEIEDSENCEIVKIQLRVVE